MTSRARRRKVSRPAFPLPWFFLLLSWILWVVLLCRQWPEGAPGFFLALAKGLALLGVAAAAFARLSRGLWPKARSFLSLFPLGWLALSRAQWHLCAQASGLDYLAPLLFMAGILWTAWRPDGKDLLSALALLWTALDILWTQALLLPLAFLTTRPTAFKNVGWVRIGGFLVFLVLAVATRAWTHWRWNGLETYEWLFEKGYAVFALFIWLGWAAFPRKGTARSALAGVAALGLGALCLAPLFSGRSPGWDGLSWIFIWAAGFGLECLRRDLLDASWHGRAVWAALGLAAFWSVF